jgi:hypothetical protein
MAHHTPEPWKYRGLQIESETEDIAELYDSGDDASNEANARRIVAAVNACKGIPTEALEGGVISELVERLRYLDSEEFNNSFLLDVLKEVK